MRGRLLAVIAATLLLAAAAAAGGAAFADRIDLQDGWPPEGIATGRGHDLFVGSIPTGAILRSDARTGEREVAVPAAPGRAAIGMKVDRHERLFVGGGPTGKGSSTTPAAPRCSRSSSSRRRAPRPSSTTSR